MVFVVCLAHFVWMAHDKYKGVYGYEMRKPSDRLVGRRNELISALLREDGTAHVSRLERDDKCRRHLNSSPNQRRKERWWTGG